MVIKNQKRHAELFSVDPRAAVLQDIHMLLHVLEVDGIETGNANVPVVRALASLNPRLVDPIALNHQRATFRSYPNIRGLYLLLRTTGLARVQRVGAKRRLVLDESNAERFRSLNPTEQFGSLLDAWLIESRLTQLDIDNRYPYDFFRSMLVCWNRITDHGRRASIDQHSKYEGPFIHEIDRVTLWLMREFGMIEFDQSRPLAGKPWYPQVVQRTPFGQALLAVLARSPALPFIQRYTVQENWHVFEQEGPPPKLKISKSATLEPEPRPLRDGIRFDALQPVLQPHWPAWQLSYELPSLPFREGAFVFEIAVHNLTRIIAIAAEDTLASLVDALLDSIGFDQDHLWDFKLKDRIGGGVHITHPYMDRAEDTYRADETLIGDLPLADGQSMKLTYDYGDRWQFDVQLQRVDEPDPRLKKPQIIESDGEPPRQYS